jgi:hypothetical protein
MSSIESNLQELKKLLYNTLSDNDHLKFSEIFSGISEDINNKTLIENDDIPDLITPPNTHRDNQSSEKSVVVESQKETMENNTKKEDLIKKGYEWAIKQSHLNISEKWIEMFDKNQI